MTLLIITINIYNSNRIHSFHRNFFSLKIMLMRFPLMYLIDNYKIKSRSESNLDFSHLLIFILIRFWNSTIRVCMDMLSNLVPELGLGFAPQNSSVSFEEPRTTRGDSKRARTGKSSSNEEVSTESVLLGSFFAFHFNTARRTKVCAMQVSPRLTQGLYRKFEGRSICGHGALLRGGGCIWTLLNLNLLFTMMLH